ncbi:MAG: ASCH domain-containing protein [Sphingobacteriia bacterium]|nr:ASCH domain-containing protein [Sphingobacteriia bacterium]
MATTGSIWVYEFDEEPILNPEDLTILTNYDESRACIIRTKSVIIKKFNEITEEEAMKEGEGDLSLEYWRRVHKEYFEEECKRIGRDFSEEMPVAYEEFEIEYKDE